MSWYSIVAWGGAPRGVYRTEQAAREAWRRLDRRANAGGSSASMEFPGARLVRCLTRAEARTADIADDDVEVIAHL